MPNYPAMYRRLMGAQTDAIEGLRAITEKLIEEHRQMEEMVMDAPETDIVLLDPLRSEVDGQDDPDC